MYKLCIWENIATPHHSHFFLTLSEHSLVDLQIRYFEKFHEERKALGWNDNIVLPEKERYVEPFVDSALATLPDWKERIHIVPGDSYEFTRSLLDTLITNDIPWIHWSERTGITLAQKLGYRVTLFNLLQPLVSRFRKKKYAQMINNYALGALAQGKLAKKDFIDWGVREEKIEYLFYTIGPIKKSSIPPNEIKHIDRSRLFIYVGSLYAGKGITQLLHAFASLKNRDTWALMLVGPDLTDGTYDKLANELEITNDVIFTGAKALSQVPDYIGHADVLVMPTLYDGWGAVLNEAAALGKPIIATDQCGSAHHILQNGKNGFRVKAGNIDDLRLAMQSYIDDPSLMPVHGGYSKRLYQERFTPEKNVERLLNALDKWTMKEMQ